MRRGRSISVFGKALQELDPPGVALLGVELDPLDVAVLYRGGVATVVVRLRQHVVGIPGDEVVGVEEIEAGAGFEFPEEPVPVAGCHVVPAHVGQMGLLGEGGLIEPLDLAVDPAEPREDPLVASLGHHLHAHADPQDGPAPPNDRLLQGGTQPRGIETPHRPVEGAHAGKNEPVGGMDCLGCLSDHGGDVEPLVDVGQGLDIAQAVVDDGDHRLPPRVRPRRRMTLAPSR